jgi:solute carrier family 25 phosphate transporter 3
VCPLDVVKTKLQTDPHLSGKSIKEAIKIIVKSDGIRVLCSGLAATFSGYFLQGFCKFGFYDLIKTKVYATVNNEDTCAKLRLPILLLSATSAEIIACVALCPMEVTRIFIVSNPQLKLGMLTAMKLIVDKDPSGLFKVFIRTCFEFYYMVVLLLVLSGLLYIEIRLYSCTLNYATNCR